MCRNHSHLIARFVGENIEGEQPVLIFELASNVLKIESPGSNGSTLMIRTSGLLYLPSYVLADWSALTKQATAEPSMCLCLMTEEERTITHQATPPWLTSFGQ